MKEGFVEGGLAEGLGVGRCGSVCILGSDLRSCAPSSAGLQRKVASYVHASAAVSSVTSSPTQISLRRIHGMVNGGLY